MTVAMRVILLTFTGALLTVNGQLGRGAAQRVRTGTSLPAACSPLKGEIFFKTAAVIGLYICPATNTWTLLAAGAGSGDVLGAANLTTAGRVVTVSAAGTVTEESAVTVTAGVVAATGVKLGAGAEGACDAANRGRTAMIQGGAGVADTIRVCAKDAADSYGWRTLY